ncbi:type II toxin-antitoxin system HicA family toxin [Granulosicoccus sp.]|nr:type II toxin-antitoxin system HicA family toxin [Granulosicoccus sp.]MDB4224913.1 type II toxin-antitoxin system HicA family toxin [Granulosicoccus sp.]
MARKIRELIKEVKSAGFEEVSGGKGSHRKFTHEHYAGAVTVSGKSSSDAKRYQEKQIGNAIESLKS